MHFNYFLGFDVSRNTLDYALIGPDGGLIERGKVDNKVANIRQLLSSLVSQLNGPSSSLLICAEEGGLYTNFLKLVAAQEEYSLWMADALELKLRSGRRKEKSDPADAWMITNFALRYADQAKIYQLPEAAIRQIKLASRQRQALIQDIVGWKNRLGELQIFGLDPLPEIEKILKGFLKQGEQALKKMDQEILRMIKADKATKRKYDIVLSVPGFGKKNTIAVIAETEVFTKIDNGRACASYAGLCPYLFNSGTSVKRRTRTSKACNKRLKTALHQGANNLLKSDNLFGDLYRRLRQNGKTRLQAINAVRNKMVRVLFACLESDVMYEKNYHERLRVQ